MVAFERLSEENMKPNIKKKQPQNPNNPNQNPPLSLELLHNLLEPVKIKYLDFIIPYSSTYNCFSRQSGLPEKIAGKWPVNFSLLHKASK